MTTVESREYEYVICRYIRDATIGVKHHQIGSISLPPMTLDDAIARLELEQRAMAAEVFPGRPQRVFAHLTAAWSLSA